MTTINSSRLAKKLSRVTSVTWAPEPTPPAWPSPAVRTFIERMRGRNYSRHTLRNYRLDLGNLEAAHGRPALELTGHEIEAYLAAMGKRTKATTVQRRLNSLRSFYKDAVKHGEIAVDPTALIEPPKAEKRLPVYLRAHEVEALLGALRHDTPAARREAAILACFYYTGMRASELVGLDIEHLQADQLKVFGKGSKERRLPITPELRRHLDAWLEVHPVGSGALFTSFGPHAHRLHYDAVRRLFHGAMARAGLAGRGFTPHKLRHTFATRLINKGMRVDKIQKLLGHSGINTTMLYAHTELAPEDAEQIGRIL